ncbi:MAG TPA: sulfite oxidase [Ktedonobacterales bacterium]
MTDTPTRRTPVAESQRQHPDDAFTFDEVRLAARNHAMPLEALRYPLTPAGLHYLLIHYDIPDLDAAAWRLEIDGAVERRLTLSLEDLKRRPAVTAPVTLECAGNGRALYVPHPVSQPWITEGIGTAAWTGAPLAPILDEAGIAPAAIEVLFTGADLGVEGGEVQHYARALPRVEALLPGVLLAYAMNGEPIPPQHGFPVRLLVPGWYGMTHVKWLRRITALAQPYTGYQNAHVYRMRTREDDPGTPVTRMVPRSLMEPPGIPDFATRDRVVAPGDCELRGRAWSGWGPITRVEVSTDGGQHWHPAALGDALADYAWRPWTYLWHAEPGSHDLCSRATDATGRAQPMRALWNLGGYMNNSVQHLVVVVAAEQTASA